jgi:hypothetical protein
VEGTVFNYCNIQAREHPQNTKEKIKLVFTMGENYRKFAGVLEEESAPAKSATIYQTGES